jgi:hypothetical protein
VPRKRNCTHSEKHSRHRSPRILEEELPSHPRGVRHNPKTHCQIVADFVQYRLQLSVGTIIAMPSQRHPQHQQVSKIHSTIWAFSYSRAVLNGFNLYVLLLNNNKLGKLCASLTEEKTQSGLEPETVTAMLVAHPLLNRGSRLPVSPVRLLFVTRLTENH